MKKIILLLLLAYAPLEVSMTLAAQSSAPAAVADADVGKQLVDKLWTAFAKPDTATLEKMMSPAFQSLHEDGARTGPEEIKLIAALKLSPYVLANFKTTRSGDALVVSYSVAVAETIDAARLSKATSPRMDIFQMSGGEWKWLAHVNVRTLATGPSNAK